MVTVPAMSSHASSAPVHQRLVDDWARLRHDPGSLRRARHWGVGPCPLTDLDEIVAAVGPDRPDDEREPAMHRLVGLARHDDLAARVVLERLLPDLLRIHRRRRWQGWDDVGLGDLLTTGWTVIRTYNPARRPSRLAHSLVSDIEYLEYRAPLRRIGHGTPIDPVGFDDLVAATPSDPLVQLARLVGAAGEALTDDDRDLIRRLLSGRMTIDIARDLGVTPRTVRNRRDRITLRLREAGLVA